ncbi:DUF3558 domain-containing protein [Amycolatopsis sp. NPDC054798]
MRSLSFAAALITAVGLSSAAACSGTNSGAALLSSAAAPTSSANTAPKVEQPIKDTARFETDPCSAIATDAIEKIGGKVARTKVENSVTDKTCAWVFSRGGNFSGSLVTGNTHGLNGVYLQHANGAITYFKTQPAIQGYPAVVYGRGQPPPGICALAVGIRDNLTYTVVTQLRQESPVYADPCGTATKLADAAISRMNGR